MSVITSRQHPIVKEFRELAHGGGPMMLLDGWHLLTEAVAAGVAIDTVALCGPPTAAEQITIERAQRAGARVIDVSGSVLNALSPVNAPTGVVASATKPRVEAATMLQPEPALILAGFGLQDPGNAGAVVRAAAAAGATGVVVDEATADPWGWKALRASMGSAFHVPVMRTRALEQLVVGWRAAGVTVVAAVPRDGTSMYDVDLTRPAALLLGGEGAGLPPSLVSSADARVTIPMKAPVESLNVAVAAALLLYEARRQRAIIGRR
jgi:TrmH family RNA methyltransferase